ncbi:MAG: ATP-binding protein [Oscillochloris sp.]|nr:ATP-binding protein [Oscillochloris sp.]
MFIEHTPPAQVLQLNLPAAYLYLPLIGESIATMLRRSERRFDYEMLLPTIQLAAHEACCAVISRAYIPGEQGRIRILLSMTQYPLPPCLMIDIEDTGRSLDMELAHEPIPEEITEGSGLLSLRLFLLNQIMHRVDYQAIGRTNRLRLVKLLV